LLVDAFEAVLGAVYLDGGIDAARPLIRKLFAVQVEEELRRDAGHGSNFKSTLQELLQGRGEATARYKMVREDGPDHAREFTVEVLVGGRAVAVGRGSNKKAAEQAAARRGLEALEYEPPGTADTAEADEG